MKLKLLHLTLILAVCVLLFFSRLGATPFYTKGEPREATVVLAMVNSGNWVLPLRNAEFIPSKPPLFHWLAILMSKSAGRIDELTLRLPSALLGTAGVLLTYLAGAYFWSPSVGLFSALVLATSFEWWLAATVARVDMTLTFVLLCFFLFFYSSYRSGGGRWNSVVLGLLLGLAVLAKGPLGIVVPCLTVLIFLWVRRDFSFLRKLHPATILLVGGLVAGSWYIAALWQGGSRFYARLFHENIDAALGRGGGHPQPLYFFIPALFARTAPWSLFFPAVAFFLYRSRRRLAEEGLVYLIVWFTVVFAFFSLASGKRPVYILSLYPAVALMLGIWWQNLLNQDELGSPVWLARTASYAVAASFLLFSIATFAQLTSVDLVDQVGGLLGTSDRWLLPVLRRVMTEQRSVLFIWATLAALGAVAMIIAARKSAWQAVFGSMSGLMIVSFTFVHNVFQPVLAAPYSFKPFMERVSQKVSGGPLYFCRSFDHGVVFYGGRDIPRYDGQVIDGNRPFYLLIWDREWENVPADGLVMLDKSEERDRDERRHLLLVQASPGARLSEKPSACQVDQGKDLEDD